MYFLHVFEGLGLVDETVAFFVKIEEHFAKEFISRGLCVVDAFIRLLLVFGIEDGQQEVHKEEESNDQECYEEDRVHTVVAVRRHHNIGVVGRGQQDDHVEEGVRECREGLNTLNRSGEQPVPHP